LLIIVDVILLFQAISLPGGLSWYEAGKWSASVSGLYQIFFLL